MGLSPDPAIVPAFPAYYKLLTEKNKVMNLTAITEETEVARLHFLDCLALLQFCDFRGKTVIDVGSGAGFPGFPLAIWEKSMSLTCLDAQRKRVNFLTEAAEALGLANVTCIHGRAEEAARTALGEHFDYALSRAVARLNVLCELCLPFVRPGGAFVAMKSVDTEEEISEAKPAVKLLGGKIRQVADYTIPGTEVTHRAVIIQKLTPTPKGYPRRFARIQKEPL
jgi:16S rRNA (guanine527-N7)-methyltransferase